MVASIGAVVAEVEVDAVVGGAVATAGSSGALQAATVNTRTIGAVTHLRMPRQYRPERWSACGVAAWYGVGSGVPRKAR